MVAAMTDGPRDQQRGTRRLPDPVLARSFGSEANRYHQLRPSYPAAAVELVLAGLGRPRDEASPAGLPQDGIPQGGAPAPDRGGRVPRILDVGAGTGKLTDSLINRQAEVVAVEPDPQMLAVLAARLPQVRALAGSAERIPLADGSVDAIVAGQAFHWFTRPDADLEFARVLRPGGVVGLLWNLPDQSVEWVPKLYRATRRPELPGWEEFGQLDGRLFTGVERASVPSVHLLPGPDGLCDLARTWSWVIARSPAEHDAIDQRLRILISQHAELQAPVVALPQRTEVRWQRRR